MPCGCSTNRTAKFSIEARSLHIRRVDTILDCLRRIRQRAAECATHDTIIASAQELPLPAPSPPETDFLGDYAACDGSLAFNHGEIGEAHLVCQPCSRTGIAEISHTTSSGESELAELPPNSLLTPWEQTVLCDLTTCIMRIEAHNEDTASLLRYKNGATEHWVLNQCAQTNSQATSTLLSDFLELHPILSIPAARSSCSSSSYSYCSSSEGDSSLVPSADGNSSDLTRNGEPDSCFHGQPVQREISASQLARLGEFIQHVEQFRDYLGLSLDKVRKSYRVQDERWRIQSSNGNMACLMKSRGYSSPLSQCIAVDEEWPSEWDLRVCDTRSIYGKYARRYVVNTIESNKDKPAREPRW